MESAKAHTTSAHPTQSIIITHIKLLKRTDHANNKQKTHQACTYSPKNESILCDTPHAVAMLFSFKRSSTTEVLRCETQLVAEILAIS